MTTVNVTTGATTTPALCMPVVMAVHPNGTSNDDSTTTTTVMNATTTNSNSNNNNNNIPADSTKKSGNTIVQLATTTSTSTSTNTTTRKRLCRFPGCERVIKSQGHCQRHGARAKRCRHPSGCDKQAQGTHEGMCKRHWRMVQTQNQPVEDVIPPHSNKIRLAAPPPPSGTSVYEFIIPNSMAYRPTPQQIYSAHHHHHQVIFDTTTGVGTNQKNNAATAADALLLPPPSSLTDAIFEPMVPPQYDPHHQNHNSTTAAAAISGMTSNNHNVKGQPQQLVMPLVHYLAMNMHLPNGWHRIHERRTRGVYPITSITTQLEGWERQLAFIEICLLSGGTPQANFKHFCHAWGRDATFVSRLSNFICERRGDTDRKKMRSADGTAADSNNKKYLKKTGVIIPRTTPLEIYRNGIADTIPKSDIVEQAVAAIIEQTVETTVDESEIMDHANNIGSTGIHHHNNNNEDNRVVMDTMLGHESESFLLMDESMMEEDEEEETNPQPDHPDMTQV